MTGSSKVTTTPRALAASSASEAVSGKPCSPTATTAIGAYIAEHGLRTGPMFNIYRVSPAQSDDPNSWVTDVCFPILDE